MESFQWKPIVVLLGITNYIYQLINASMTQNYSIVCTEWMNEERGAKSVKSKLKYFILTFKDHCSAFPQAWIASPKNTKYQPDLKFHLKPYVYRKSTLNSNKVLTMRNIFNTIFMRLFFCSHFVIRNIRQPKKVQKFILQIFIFHSNKKKVKWNVPQANFLRKTWTNDVSLAKKVFHIWLELRDRDVAWCVLFDIHDSTTSAIYRIAPYFLHPISLILIRLHYKLREFISNIVDNDSSENELWEKNSKWKSKKRINFSVLFFLKIENRINSSMNKKINCKKEHCKFMTLETH